MLVQWQPLGLLLTQISLFRGNNLGFLLYSCLPVSTTNTLLKGACCLKPGAAVFSVMNYFVSMRAFPCGAEKHKVINLSGSKKEDNLGT